MLTLSLRDLRAHAGRYVLTFLAVTIGVGFVSGVITLTDTISRTYDDLFAGLNGGTDVAVRGTGQFELGAEFGGGVQRPRIARSLAEEVAEVDGVAAAEGAVQGYARPIGPDGEPYGNPTFGAPTIGMSWGEVDELNPFVLFNGRAPEGPGEIVLDKHTADEIGYRVGDTAQFQTPGGLNEATVVGIARFGTADSPAGSAMTLMHLPTAQLMLAEPGQVDLIAVVAEEGRSQAEVRDAVREALAGANVEVVTGDELVAEAQETAQDTFSGIRTFLLAFALISVLVGTFVIYTSFSFIVAQRQRQGAHVRGDRIAAGRGGGVGRGLRGGRRAGDGVDRRLRAGHLTGDPAALGGHRPDGGQGGVDGVGAVPGRPGLAGAARRRHARRRDRHEPPVARPARGRRAAGPGGPPAPRG